MKIERTIRLSNMVAAIIRLSNMVAAIITFGVGIYFIIDGNLILALMEFFLSALNVWAAYGFKSCIKGEKETVRRIQIMRLLIRWRNEKN